MEMDENSSGAEHFSLSLSPPGQAEEKTESETQRRKVSPGMQANERAASEEPKSQATRAGVATRRAMANSLAWKLRLDIS